MKPSASRTKTPGRQRGRHGLQPVEGEGLHAAGGQREAGKQGEGAAEREEDVGERMRLGELAAQDQEVRAEGEHFPGGEEGEAGLRFDQHAQGPAYMSMAGRVEADAAAALGEGGQQDHRAAKEHDDRRRASAAGRSSA